jgi:hypothetical protein
MSGQSVSIETLSGRVRARRLVEVGAAIAAALILLTAPGRVAAQENGDCLTCHADKDLTKERHGRITSLFVDEARFAAGVHGKHGASGATAQGRGVPPR